VDVQQGELQMMSDVITTEETVQNGIRTPLDAPIHALAKRFGARAKEMERFFRFAVVGVTGAVIDLGLLFLLQATIIPPVDRTAIAFASGIAFFTAVISNFFWTRMWVYPDSRTRSARRQLVMFTMVSIAGGAFRLGWMALMAFPIGHLVMPLAVPFIQILRPGYIPTELAEGRIGSIIAQLIAMVVVMLWNFFANRHWTYNDVE
jgi:putative flippase GtrA